MYILSCSQCSFTTQFASALIMHRQLEHDTPGCDILPGLNTLKTKSETIPRPSTALAKYDLGADRNRPYKGLSRSNSATRLFEKLRSKICKSKVGLFVHPEETSNLDVTGSIQNNLHQMLEPPSNPMKEDSTAFRTINGNYRCHLCTFVADRITVLDRHLLNDHKIGLDQLLQLVMAKTKEGIVAELDHNLASVVDTYYKAQDDIIQEGEIIIETVKPKIKILKHMSTNTDLHWKDIPDIKDNCQMITRELEGLMNLPLSESSNNEDLFSKMQNLNKYMCKFIESNNTLKRVLKKDLVDSKSAMDSRRNASINDDYYNFGVGDQEARRNWSVCRHSDSMERSRIRSDKPKSTSSSFYY